DDDGHVIIDIAEAAFQEARDRAVLRVHPGILGQWQDNPAVQALLDWAAQPDRETDPGELEEILDRLADETVGEEVRPIPSWMRVAARALADHCEITPNPCGGYVLTSRTQISLERQHKHDAFSDDDDIWSKSPLPVTLR